MFLRRIFTSDRRRQPRQFLNTSVRVLNGAASIEGLGINVSDVGMCLFTAAHLSVGKEIEVEFLPLGSNETMRFSATVRHRAFYLYGIEFHAHAVQATGHIAAYEAESPRR